MGPAGSWAEVQVGVGGGVSGGLGSHPDPFSLWGPPPAGTGRLRPGPPGSGSGVRIWSGPICVPAVPLARGCPWRVGAPDARPALPGAPGERAGRLQGPRWGEPGRRVHGSHGPGCGGPVLGTRVWEGALGLRNRASHRCAGSLSGVKEDPGVWGGLWVPWGRCGAGRFQCQADCGAGGLWAGPRGPQRRGRWVGAWGPRDQGKWASWSFSWPPAWPRVPWLPWFLRAAYRRLRWSCQHVLAVGRLRHREQVTMPGKS